jgi:isopenicillin-N epimerase
VTRAETSGSSALARHWALDPGVTFLNHGSFGACPRAVLDYQRSLVSELELEPVRFMVRELETRLDEARRSLGAFIGSDPDDLVFVRNATEGVNTVLRSFPIRAGDEILVTDHEYNACRNALDVVASERGARVVVARVPFPLRSEDDVVEAILPLVTSRTRLALLDFVTSQTGLVLPIERLVNGLAERGVDVLVDAAHAAGMVDLDLRRLSAAYVTGNCHKWICSPKGSAFLHVRRDRRQDLRPLSISHGANSPRTDRSRFLIEFDWVGTIDPIPWLCIGPAITFLEGLVPGGWPEIRRRNRALALEGRRILCDALRIEAPAPESMIGAMAAMPLPAGRVAPASPLFIDPIQDALWRRHAIEVPVNLWPAWPSRVLRVSAQLYNDRSQYERLAAALVEELAAEGRKE